jgi:hypothetical protein
MVGTRPPLISSRKFTDSAKQIFSAHLLNATVAVDGPVVVASEHGITAQQREYGGVAKVHCGNDLANADYEFAAM